MRKLPFIILTFAFLLVQCSGNKAVNLVKNNRSDYKIVISENADAKTIRAAEIFREYIQKSSGVALPVVADTCIGTSKEILIGGSKRLREFPELLKIKPLPEDGYRIKTFGARMVILGGGKNGLIYGVTGFLRDYLGCRKFSPVEEFVPQKENISIPAIDKFDSPKVNFRCVNGVFNRDPSYREWHRIDQVSDIFAQGYYVHTFERLIPWEEYFAEHPEYFAEVGGRRTNQQLCMTHPEVVRIIIEKLRSEMKKQPEKQVWSVSQNDNAIYCTCPECQKIIDREGSPAGPVFDLVNKVAEAFPDKIISTLAYRFSRHAPRYLKPRENVQVMLCTIECERSRPIADNPEPESQSFQQDMMDWNAISDRIYLWDYTVNFHHHVSPFPNLHVLQPNIQFFLKNDAYEMFQQTNTAIGHEFSELKSAMIAALLWDPFANIDSVRQDFLDHFYGDAAGKISQYIDDLEKTTLASGQVLDIYGHPVSLSEKLLSPDNARRFMQILDTAETIVEDQPVYLNRVRVARLPLQYALMEIGKNDMFGERGWYKKEEGKYILRQDMKARFDRFIEVCEQNNIQSLDERGLTPEKYLQATEHFIDVQIEGNLAFEKPVTAHPHPAQKYSGGDLMKLTNGVQGANDYKAHWLGWEAEDFDLLLDLGKITSGRTIKTNSLYDQNSWILHPKQVECLISKEGRNFATLGNIEVSGDQRDEERIRSYIFQSGENFRYVKIRIRGTKALPDWHPSAGGKSWVFIDEITVQ
ncbi:MAG: DUF4838 domain-containing protein [Candidatus Marinimicrobia bacterium]|nr:DUF4838 domain-containing protein [Candidatus Neomarinimicrobiota bacterium]